MKRILLILTVLLLSLGGFAQQIYTTDGDFRFITINSDETYFKHLGIKIEKNGELYDSIWFKDFTDVTDVQYTLGNSDGAFLKKDQTKFYFGKYFELFEYDMKKKSTRKILTSENSYRIITVLECGTLVLIKGWVNPTKNKPYEYRKQPNGDYKFVISYFNPSTETLEDLVLKFDKNKKLTVESGITTLNSGTSHEIEGLEGNNIKYGLTDDGKYPLFYIDYVNKNGSVETVSFRILEYESRLVQSRGKLKNN